MGDLFIAVEGIGHMIFKRYVSILKIEPQRPASLPFPVELSGRRELWTDVLTLSLVHSGSHNFGMKRRPNQSRGGKDEFKVGEVAGWHPLPNLSKPLG